MKAIFLLTGIFVSVCLYSQYSITGTVYDTDGKPLSGAHITINEGFSGAITNSDGSFTFKKLSQGSYKFKASFLGFESMEKLISVPGETTISFELAHSPLLGEETIITSVRAGAKDPIAATDINRKKLQENNFGQDIPWLLNQTPSLVASSDAGAGVGYTGFRIRGTDANRINITVNGIPLNDAESHSVYFVNMPDFASSTENIQVQRGVGTSQNGAAAFGASINFQTLSLKPESYSEISSTYGSFNTFKNSVSFGTGLLNNHFTLDARLSGIKSDGYIDRAFSDLNSYFLSAGWHSAKSIVKLNVFSGNEKTYQAWDGVPSYMLTTNRRYNGLGKYTDESGNDQYYKNQTDNYTQNHYQLHVSRELSPFMIVNASLHLTHGEGYYEEYKEDQGLTAYNIPDISFDTTTISTTDLIRRKWLDNNFYGIVLSSTYKKNNIDASFGGAWNRYEGDHFGTVIWARNAGISEMDHIWYESNSDKKDYNIFGKVSYSISNNFNLYADMQMRGINYEIDGEDDDHRDISQKHDYLFFNPKLGLNYTNNSGKRLYASFSLANREPNRSNFIDADPNLAPPSFETLYDYEAGYTISQNNFQAGLNIYFMDYDNQLVLTGEINDVGSAIMTNVNNSYRTGIELTAGIMQKDLFIWNVNLTLSKNKINKFSSYVDNWNYWDDPSTQPLQYEYYLGKTNIAFSPEIIASSNFRYFVAKNLSMDFISKYVGSQFTDNTSSANRKLDPYLVNDLRIEYILKPKFLKELALNLYIANLFNYEYSSNAWVYRYKYNGVESAMDGYFPQAGINFMAGIRAKF